MAVCATDHFTRLRQEELGGAGVYSMDERLLWAGVKEVRACMNPNCSCSY